MICKLFLLRFPASAACRMHLLQSRPRFASLSQCSISYDTAVQAYKDLQKIQHSVAGMNNCVGQYRIPSAALIVCVLILYYDFVLCYLSKKSHMGAARLSRITD